MPRGIKGTGKYSKAPKEVPITKEEVPIKAVTDEEIAAKEARIAELEAKEKQLTDKLEGKIPLIPSEFRRTVDEILGAEFGLNVQTMSDRPVFKIVIEVPPQYSNLTKQELELHKKDLRSKVIPNSEGLNGVKMWAEAVRKNLKSSFETNRPTPNS